MPDIEFLPESVDGNDDEEELPGGGRGISRWLGGGALAVVCLAALVVAMTRGHGGPAAPTPAPGPETVVTDLVGAPDTAVTPLFLGEYTHEPVLDVAVTGPETWVLQSSGIRVLRPRHERRDLVIPAGLHDAHLVLDRSAGQMWIVAPGYAQEFDTATLDSRPGVFVPAFDAVAALDRNLYFVSANRLLRLGPRDPAPVPILSFRAPLSAIVADPARHRLLVADFARRAGVHAVTVTPAGRARVELTSSLAMVKPTLAVAGDVIWAAGFDTGDGVLIRLDPATLRPVRHSSLDPLLEPGAALVAGGTEVVWVRDGAGGNQLRCIAAGTGLQLQTWNLAGTLASTSGRAVLGTIGGAEQLVLNRCPG
jgi:hypothetical protein